MRNRPLNSTSIKQSQKRNGLLKGDGIERVLNLVAWRIECDTGRLSTLECHRKKLPKKSPKVYLISYMACMHSILVALLQLVTSVQLRMTRYEEIANLSEEEDVKEDVAKAMEDGTVLPIILRLQMALYACLSYEAGRSHATSYEAGPSHATSYEAGPSHATSYEAGPLHVRLVLHNVCNPSPDMLKECLIWVPLLKQQEAHGGNWDVFHALANHTAMEPLHSHQVAFQRKCCNNFPGYRNLPMLHPVPLSDQREEVVMEQYQVYLCCLHTNIHIKRLSVRIAFYTTMNKVRCQIKM
ncbi:hypothetical protein EMCRGX_G026388 [Ephydatia muelleri]